MSISWTVTKDTASDTVRFECVGANPIDLTQVQIGDYANVFGSGFNALNKGSFQITNVEVYYVASTTLHQAFELTNRVGVSETATQSANVDLTFFRPTINTTQNSDGRTVVVSSTVDGNLEVSIPATTQAVSRTVDTGSYLHENSAVVVNRINRDKNGEVTIFYSGSPNPVLSDGDFFFLDGLEATPPQYFRDLGVIDTWPASSTTDAATIDNVNVLQEITDGNDDGRINFDMILASNGDGLIVGGSTLVAGTPTTSARISRFRPLSQAIVTDGTLADGATRYTYEWETDGTTTNSTELNKAANITVGPLVGKVMINGGADIALGNYSSTTSTAGSSRAFDPVAGTTSASGTDPASFCGHTLTTLVDGRILSYGGANTISNFIEGRNSKAGYIWNPATQAWPSVGVNDIATTWARAHHASVALANSKILFIGGLAGAQEFENDSKTLAYWKLAEASSPLIDTVGSYNLTTSGTTARVSAAKVGSGREFTQTAAYASGAGDAPAVTALLGAWTIEWWSCGATGTYPSSMTLSGLGEGPILSYGTASEAAEGDNTLMHVSITSGNLAFHWQHNTNVDVTGSVAIAGHIVDHYNHFAVRKTFNGTTYNVDLFVNGRKIGSTFTSLTNATGGGNSRWYLARDPNGVTGFTGVIDNVVVEKYARSDEDILLDYWKGSPTLPTSAGSRSHRIGPCLEYCEIFNPNNNTVATTASMALGRAYHTGTLLPDGRVLVIGGISHDPTNITAKLIAAGPTSLNGCSESTNTSEIYDPATQQWTKGPTFMSRRHKHAAIYVPSRNEIFVIGGTSTQGDDCLYIEVLDIATMKTRTLSEKLTFTASDAVLMPNNTILVGTNQSNGSGGILKTHQLISLESPGLSSKGLADYHVIASTGSGFFKFETPTAPYFYSNFSVPSGDATTYTITNAERASNVTTITFATAHPFQAHDLVFVNFNNEVLFTSGVFSVTTATTNTISYTETASDQSIVIENGSVYKNFSPDATITPWAAQTDTIPGPYLIDPLEGVSISSLKSSVGGPLYTGIFKGQKYVTLPVVDATQFPDTAGFVVLGFGTDLQTQPIKYFGRYNATGLLIDYNYAFQETMPNGTEVVLLTQRDPFVPTTLVGEFYATASAAGRVAAENTIQDIAAAGINLNVTIVYPGDRGLGGEGLPAKGATKLSDKVAVWGGDDLDNEIATLKDS